MTTVQPKGETIRKATQWAAEQRQADPAVNIERLVEQAGIKFNLSPKEADFLRRFLKGETA